MDDWNLDKKSLSKCHSLQTIYNSITSNMFYKEMTNNMKFKFSVDDTCTGGLKNILLSKKNRVGDTKYNV